MPYGLQEDPDRETGANENVPSCLHLRGKLNVGALEDALALLVQRHEVLHARYTMRHGEVLQVSACAATHLRTLADQSLPQQCPMASPYACCTCSHRPVGSVKGATAQVSCR